MMIKKLWVLSLVVSDKIFLNLYFRNHFSDSVIYSCNQPEPSEQFRRGRHKDNFCEVLLKSSRSNGFQRRYIYYFFRDDARLAVHDSVQKSVTIPRHKHFVKMFVNSTNPISMLLIWSSVLLGWSWRILSIARWSLYSSSAKLCQFPIFLAILPNDWSLRSAEKY